MDQYGLAKYVQILCSFVEKPAICLYALGSNWIRKTRTVKYKYTVENSIEEMQYLATRNVT